MVSFHPFSFPVASLRESNIQIQLPISFFPPLGHSNEAALDLRTALHRELIKSLRNFRGRNMDDLYKVFRDQNPGPEIK